MIPDKVFKALKHECEEYSIYSKGQEVELGYKPDFVLNSGNSYIILESENSASRKTYVGGMVKAAHFLQGPKTGILVFVIVPKENTKASSIANHLVKYFKWIKDKTNLSEVYVIEASHYYIDGMVASVNSDNFLSKAIKVE